MVQIEDKLDFPPEVLKKIACAMVSTQLMKTL